MSGLATSPAESATTTLPPRGAFIVGVARSGTSLLRSLLDGHPGAYVLPEETFAAEWCRAPDPVGALFHDRPFGERYPVGTERRRSLETSLRSRLSGPVDVRTALTVLMGALAQHDPPPAGALVWIEKTPRHLLHVPVLMDAFGPRTRIVHVVRDPRAVLASQNRAWNRTGLRVARRFGRQWMQADRLAHEYAQRYGQFLVVRYEDLVIDTEAVLGQVLAHLRLPFHATVLHPTLLGQAWRANSSYGDAGVRVTGGSRRRYHEVLSARELARLEELVGPRMRQWGYELEHPARNRFPWRRLSVELAARGHVARRRRRWSRTVSSRPPTPREPATDSA